MATLECGSSDPDYVPDEGEEKYMRNNSGLHEIAGTIAARRSPSHGLFERSPHAASARGREGERESVFPDLRSQNGYVSGDMKQQLPGPGD